MFRLILVQALLFFVPFAVYAAFLWLSKRDAGDRDNWSGNTTGLVLIGVVLAVLGLLALSIFDGAGPGSNYVPAELQDGRIVPGRFE